MKKRFVTIYGGAGLTGEIPGFVEKLSYALLEQLDIKLVTGGFYNSTATVEDISTDVSVLRGAQRFATAKNIPLETRFETWLPDPEKDRLKEGVERFKEGKVREMKGDSPYARRFAMVRDTDLIITIKGKKHTATVLGFADAMNKPALPIAFTGGDSGKYWEKHSTRIRQWFDIESAFAAELEDAGSLSAARQPSFIQKIVDAVRKGLQDESANKQLYHRQQKSWSIEQRASGDFSVSPPPKMPPLTPTKNVLAEDQPPPLQPPPKPKPKQYKVFLSYSHKDAELKNQLYTHLAALIRSDMISVWHDPMISGGDSWDDTIKDQLAAADIILLLISSDFIASEYIWKVELAYAIDRHKQEKAKVIPIFLRKVYFKGLPFEHLQGYPKDAVPVTAFADRDEAFFQITNGIITDIQKWNKN